MKNFNDSTRNRSRDLPVCSAVPQLTAPPHNQNILSVTTRQAVQAKRMSEERLHTIVSMGKQYNINSERVFLT